MKKIIINVKVEIGEICYLITDKEQNERMCTGINSRGDGVSYELSQGSSTSWHKDYEFSREKDIIKLTSN